MRWFKLFKTIKNAFKTADVRKRLLYTLLLIVLFRLGCYITVPGVDTFALAETMNSSTMSLTSLIDTISGGAFSNLSIFAMSITPYITASIVIQLLGMIIPSLEKLMKEGGETSRAKVNKYTKLTAIVLALVEALGIYISYRSSGIFKDTGFLTGAVIVVSLITGTSILMWLGEQITNKGVGNGISMIIFIGIISGLPRGLVTLWNLIVTEGAVSTVRNYHSFANYCWSNYLNCRCYFRATSREKNTSAICQKSSGKKNVWWTKYSYSTKTCHGRCYANYFCK